MRDDCLQAWCVGDIADYFEWLDRDKIGFDRFALISQFFNLALR